VKVSHHLEDLWLTIRIILDCILTKEDGKLWNRFIWITAGTNG